MSMSKRAEAAEPAVRGAHTDTANQKDLAPGVAVEGSSSNCSSKNTWGWESCLVSTRDGTHEARRRPAVWHPPRMRW